MTAIILVWNPDEWNDWTYPAVLEEVAETGRFLIDWEVGAVGTASAAGSAVDSAGGAAGSGMSAAWPTSPLPAQRRGSCSRAATGAA